MHVALLASATCPGAQRLLLLAAGIGASGLHDTQGKEVLLPELAELTAGVSNMQPLVSCVAASPGRQHHQVGQGRAKVRQGVVRA
jgi:hypothetical protein